MRGLSSRPRKEQGDPNDPWRIDDEEMGYMGSTTDVHDRVEQIKQSEDPAWLERVLAWRNTQQTVKAAAETRLRVLARRAKGDAA